ncbi:MAG: flagellar protein FlgN [Legionella sp.]|nr:MAG: flagellar protein FlgN [Legionella sp.]
MNNNQEAKELISQLVQEINWIEELNTFLSEEKIVLATRQFDKLEDLAEKKQQLTANLEESANKRVSLMTLGNKKPDNQAAMLEFLSKCSAEDALQINQLNNKLAEKLIYCRDLNTVNGQVIANNLHTRQEIVNALSGNKAVGVSVYTSNGELSTPADTKHHQEA